MNCTGKEIYFLGLGIGHVFPLSGKQENSCVKKPQETKSVPPPQHPPNRLCMNHALTIFFSR